MSRKIHIISITNLSCIAVLYMISFFVLPFTGMSQTFDIASLYSKKTLQIERAKQQQGLYKYSLIPLLTMQPDSTNEYSFESGLGAISQFMIKNDTTKKIVDKLVVNYPILSNSTKRALLEVIYGLYKNDYDAPLMAFWRTEENIKLWAMLSLILQKNKETFYKSDDDRAIFIRRITDTAHPILTELQKYNDYAYRPKKPISDLGGLFANQRHIGTKIIYSLQRHNRDYPGLAIIQNEDGSFVKDANGHVKTFVQLARSASNLPYFMTDGSTPQGIFRIDSTAISNNLAIGPTPNIQLRMPNEIVGDSFFIRLNQPILNDTVFLEEYNKLLPKSWRNVEMQQSFFAGKCGRSEIIAHGTTIDPSFYKQDLFYPNTPTMGCLCAKENWDAKTGKLLQSDQLDMVNAFLSTPGASGYLFVINVDDQQLPMSKMEVEKWVRDYEIKAKK